MSRLHALVGRVALLGLAAVLVLSAMTRLVSANLAGIAEAPAEAPPPSAPVAEELELLLAAVADRDEALARREAQVALREQDLRVAREAVERALADLAEAEAALEARMYASDGASEADLGRLTAIYEGMKPKDAAAVFETMDPAFAAGFLARMAPPAAAAVFSNLQPLTAYAVSAAIAGRNAGAATEEPAQ
ncbi:MotE family protein [Jannaschia sp. W003]|uniref:MotE family protein n=1 Tax=Jannaschia sp. W003 TaxID=2867012 RepID=UPI0021A63572|nr:hypothetical protein [Jannaschia sp. W003]UWQ21824.1 hypothetical protein K3554_01990 [Jannaschia sp. W003]